MFQRFAWTLELVAAGIIGAVFTSLIALAWTGPTQAPPNGNVAAPLNVGSTDQIKDGGLGLNSLAVFGNAILSGSSRYLNFGTLAGSSGYGIRDSGGTLQFKNSGGTWSALAGGGAAIPAGAIMAFDATTCPTGWSEYTQARGRFLRGIDNGAGNDPSGTRAPGSIQQDAFQGHEHFNADLLTLVGNSGEGVDSGPGWPRTHYSNTAGIYSAGYGTPRITTETRPKNVAVLFCRKD